MITWRPVEVREQKIGEAQDLAGALLDAEARLGEMLKEVPKAKNQYAQDSAVHSTFKGKTVKELGFEVKQAQRFEALADNLDVIELVKADAGQNPSLLIKGKPVTKWRLRPLYGLALFSRYENNA